VRCRGRKERRRSVSREQLKMRICNCVEVRVSFPHMEGGHLTAYSKVEHILSWTHHVFNKLKIVIIMTDGYSVLTGRAFLFEPAK